MQYHPEGISHILMLFDVMEKLCEYFNERDLVTCSAVCRDWRRMFSCDAIWKPRCGQKRTLELDDHLRSTPCVVEPPFATPEAEVEDTESSSSHENRWKLAYFREKHLWNNWTKGRSKEKEVTRIASNRFDRFDRHIKNIGFLSDDLVYIVCLNHFEVWNVSNVTAVKISELPLRLTAAEVFSFKVIGENYNLGFTIDYNTRITTFELNAVSGTISELSTFEYADNKPTTVRESFNRFAILGTTFIGIIRGTTRLHIWDLESCTKLKEEVVGSSQLLVDLFSSPEVTDAVAVVTRDMTENYDPEDSLVYIYQVYSLTKGQFFDFKTESKLSNYVCRCALLKDFIALLDVFNEFRVFNFHTSELIYSLQGENDPERWLVCCTVGRYFYHSECYFDPVTKSDRMGLTGTVAVLPLHQLRALGKNCCVAGGMGNIFCDLQNEKLNITRIDNLPKGWIIPPNWTFITINPSCSRLFYQENYNYLVGTTSSETDGNVPVDVFKIMQFW